MAFPLCADQVRQTEARLRRKLPNSFVARMLRENGGVVVVDGEEWELHPILDQSDAKHLSRTCNDIIRETAAAKEWPRFPAHGLSIGTNGFGDHLILLPSYEDQESFGATVYEWAHETGDVVQVALDFATLSSQSS